MPVRISKLDQDLGDRDAPPGSPSWVKYFIRRTKIASQELDSDVQRLQNLLTKLDNHLAWKTLGYLSFENFCITELQLDNQTLAAIRAAPPNAKIGDILQVKLDAENAPPLSKHGEIGNGRRGSGRTSTRGETKSYLARRLRRDHEEIFAKLETYPSVRAAAIEAGIIKPETALKLLRKAWKKATEGERKTFLEEIQ